MKIKETGWEVIEEDADPWLYRCAHIYKHIHCTHAIISSRKEIWRFETFLRTMKI